MAKREKELGKESASVAKQASEAAKKSEQLAKQEAEVGEGRFSLQCSSKLSPLGSSTGIPLKENLKEKSVLRGKDTTVCLVFDILRMLFANMCPADQAERGDPGTEAG